MMELSIPATSLGSIQKISQSLRRAWSEAIHGALVIVVDDAIDFNLRLAFENLYGAPRLGDVVRCHIFGIVTASSTTRPAFDTGHWPDRVDISIYNGERKWGR